MPELVSEEKAIGTYKLKVQREYDLEDEDKIFVSISLSDDMIKLIRKGTLTETTPYTYMGGTSIEGRNVYSDQISRYKVKSWLYGSLGSSYRDCLFDQELVDSGKQSFGFLSLRDLDRFLDGFKDNFRMLIQTTLKAENLNQTITYSVQR